MFLSAVIQFLIKSKITHVQNWIDISRSVCFFMVRNDYISLQTPVISRPLLWMSFPTGQNMGEENHKAPRRALWWSFSHTLSKLQSRCPSQPNYPSQVRLAFSCQKQNPETTDRQISILQPWLVRKVQGRRRERERVRGSEAFDLDTAMTVIVIQIVVKA